MTWFHDSVPDAWVLVDPPQVDSLRLYTLIPAVSGTVKNWANDLEHISSMGFNAVHLLPLTSLDTSRSPYAARNLFEVDPSYLAPDSDLDGLGQLEQFIEAAKRLNIRLCFDLVLNHVGTDSDIARRARNGSHPTRLNPMACGGRVSGRTKAGRNGTTLFSSTTSTLRSRFATTSCLHDAVRPVLGKVCERYQWICSFR